MTKNVYRTLFFKTLTLSAFTFGGGYLIVPLLREAFSQKLKWVDEDEILDLTAISQSAPGAVAVNSSVIVGYRIGGFKGAMVALLGTVLPPLCIISVISIFYAAFRDNLIVQKVLKGTGAGVAAIIIDVIFSLAKEIVALKKVLPLIIMVASFVAACVFKVNVAYIILTCALLGVMLTIRDEKRGTK